MGFNGFHNEDFAVFAIEGLDKRMKAIKSKVSPKLEELGDILGPELSALTEDEMYKHVARHARRSVNPPDDTWVALADDKRGYKKHPHFQIGLWRTHLFIWFAVINESRNKAAIAENMDKHLDDIKKQIPNDYVWSTDHTEPGVVPQREADLEAMLDRLQNIKKAEILCGRTIECNNPILQDGEKLTAEIEKTFQTVLPLYKWAKEA